MCTYARLAKFYFRRSRDAAFSYPATKGKKMNIRKKKRVFYYYYLLRRIIIYFIYLRTGIQDSLTRSELTTLLKYYFPPLDNNYCSTDLERGEKRLSHYL